MPLQSTQLEISSGLSELKGLVGTLGSAENAAWWNCSFLSQTGIETLNFNFPRTALSAAVAATSKAAANKHDEAVGAVGVFHLFRLPPGLTEKVHGQLVADNSNLAEIIASQDACMEHLRELGDDKITDAMGPGARNLGEFELEDESLVPRLAASYLKAFEENYETFPFFTLS